MVRPAALLAASLLAASATGQEYTPYVAEASPEAERTMETFELVDGIDVSLVAAEPHLANPVAFHVDVHGDVYVAETFRLHAGVTDIRSHMDWLEDELNTWTVADRAEMYERLEGDDYAKYGTEHDRVKLLRDTDGDGRVDTSFVFADGFNDPMAGIAAGVLSHEGEVYFTCIPELWRLRDADGDGRADEREALSEGYGVRTTLLGHDLHGLIVGPDRRLYFSCGDRGFHVELPDGRVLDYPEEGAVLRCELDGSNLEVVHRGLRNPQELAFDDHGDLFTGDNNSDGADRARWVHVVWGGDSGWRSPYQWIHDRGPWHNEGLWRPQHDGRPADTLPPIANLGNGPSGLSHYPGTGLGDEYAGHFFLCDFRGAASISGVHVFDLKPKGAGYELGDVEWFVRGSLTTDADFGPDGALYLLDWVEGWGMTGKGRVYRLSDADHAEAGRRTADLLAAGMSDRAVDELAGLLSHADRRVRQAAHFELSDRGADGRAALRDVAFGSAVARVEHLARFHAVWGLGIAGRHTDGAWEDLVELAASTDDDELLTQVLRVLGDERVPDARGALLAGLDHPAARVRMAAAQGCGRLALAEAVEPLAALLDATGHDDPTLRHGAVMGLEGAADARALHRLAADPSPHVRLGALLVWRRAADPALTMFLSDEDPFLVREAARAIHDLGIEAGLPALAALLDRADVDDDAVLRRALAANLRLGQSWNARRVARVALDEARPEFLRVDALEMLGAWAEPTAIDSVHHGWRPIDARRTPGVADHLASLAHDGVDAAPRAVAAAWVEAVGTQLDADADLDRWTRDVFVDRLVAWVDGDDGEVSRDGDFDDVRVAAFETLEQLALPDWDARVDRALASDVAALRGAALTALERLSPDAALARLPDIVENGDLSEQRVALEMLARLEGEAGDELVAALIERHVIGTFPQELALELVLAAEARLGDEALVASSVLHSVAETSPAAPRRRIEFALETLDERRAGDEDLGPWLDTLAGGDPRAGDAIFHRESLSCARCHATWNAASERVGPNFVDMGDRRSAVSFLESVVAPNRRIVKGYGGTNLFLVSGDVLSGRVIDEDDVYVVLQDSDGERHTIPHEEIDERRTGLSAMPEGLADGLTRTEMRDLIAYLKTL